MTEKDFFYPEWKTYTKLGLVIVAILVAIYFLWYKNKDEQDYETYRI